ncbi:DoxX family protein [Gordonia sp. CPCC 205515]|uniref:DoxX family protein n=1 Tax=Gordonia sp. CPCC 205515 TaxID=3140791 RepID=UPI003AF36F02
MNERDPNADSASSPYDESTGQIPVDPDARVRRRLIPASERDEFYAQHAATRPPTDPSVGMARVDDLDDIDPSDLPRDDTKTTPMVVQRATPPPAAPPQQSAAPPPPVPTQQTDMPATPPPRQPVPPPAPAAPPASPAAATPPARPPQPMPVPPEPVPSPTPVRAEPVVVEPQRAAPTEVMAAPVAPAPVVVPPPTDPLPAQQPYDAETVAIGATDADEAVPATEEPRTLEHDLAEARRNARRGTLDFGLLLLRVAVGLIALAHGTQKLFGWWNGPRLSGFEDFLANSPNPAIGFHADAVKPLAIVGALSETLGGLMLVIGLFTPIAASAVLGVMLVAAAFKSTVAGGVWFFATGQNGAGIEYELLLAVCAAAIILTGPGRISLDAPRGWARRPAWGSLACLVVGVVAAVIIWIMFNGTNPFESPGNPT